MNVDVIPKTINTSKVVGCSHILFKEENQTATKSNSTKFKAKNKQ